MPAQRQAASPRRSTAWPTSCARSAAQAREAARELALAADRARRTPRCCAAAREIRAQAAAIIDANERDLAAAKADAAPPAAFLDRLTLDPKRIEAMAKGLEEIAALPDPVGSVLAEWTRPNGLQIERVRVPLGVIGIIYESRPNVTADAGALCLKAGNAAILRGGSDSHHSEPRHPGLPRPRACARPACPTTAIQLVPTTDREAVGLMLKGLDGAIDVIVPRGGKSLVARVQEEARVPVFAHLEGICHTYVDRSADLAMAKADRRQRQDAAHRRVRRHRDAAGRRQGAAPATCRRWSKRCSKPAARCAATRRRRLPTPGSSRRPRRTGRRSISTPSSR